MSETPIPIPAQEGTPITPTPLPQAEPIPLAQAKLALQAPPSAQLLLGTDKGNPVFAVYQEDWGERLLVF